MLRRQGWQAARFAGRFLAFCKTGRDPRDEPGEGRWRRGVDSIVRHFREPNFRGLVVRGLTHLSSISHSGEAVGLGGIGRLIRQICLLREQADPAGAARLQENELATAVCELRAARGTDALLENELQAMFVAEERRVADAVVLSELLIPQLASYLSASARPAPAAARLVAAETPPPARRAATGAPAIPDLLDAMLAAERTSPRTRR